MKKSAYWWFVAISALMAGALVGAPIWDYWHYRAARIPSLPAPMATVVAYTTLPHIETAAATPNVASNPTVVGKLERDSPLAGAPPTTACTTPGGSVQSPTPGSWSERGMGTLSGTRKISSGRPAAGPESETGAAGVEQPSNRTPFSVAGWAGAVPAAALQRVPPQTARSSMSTAAAQGGAEQVSTVTGTGKAPPSADPADIGPPRLSLVPLRPAVMPGDVFTVGVVLSAPTPVTSVPFHVQFDPGLLEYAGVRTGPALGARSLQPIILAGVNPDRPGDLAVGLSLVKSSGMFSGSGTLILLDFRAIDSGESDLVLEEASVRGAMSEPLPARFEGTIAKVH